MQFLKDKKFKYFDLVLAIVVAFILIRTIDNYTFLMSGLNKFLAIISPFTFAFIIAYMLNPIMNLLERKCKLKRAMSLLITYIFIIGVITLFFVDLMPKIYNSLLDIIKNAPQFANEAQEWLNRFLLDEKIQSFITSTGMTNIKPDFLVSKFSSNIILIINTIFSKTLVFTNYFIKWIFGFIISIYVLYDKERFLNIAKKFIYIVFKDKNAKRLLNFTGNIHRMIGIYIGIKAVDSLIIAILAFIGLSIIKSPYILIITVVVGVTNMIPYFGPLVGMVVGFIINLFFNPLKAFIVLLFIFLLQQFDGWYLDPKLVGGKVGLSPFLVILAVTVGGGLYGPIGMLLATPTMAVIKIYADKLFSKYDNIKEMKSKNDSVNEKDLANE
ncbi:AI-2E family transporter [Desnuesiella massiliensis]|uniref:AI-2E family transporter n=1 Tax=Desnuesiella massiliensis TaxID=1650662 RepID=UPI0006E1E92A|nr:AI-2E family transporter [Desnuesiella massiliensis]